MINIQSPRRERKRLAKDKSLSVFSVQSKKGGYDIYFGNHSADPDTWRWMGKANFETINDKMESARYKMRRYL
jgi:hypothetical protein